MTEMMDAVPEKVDLSKYIETRLYFSLLVLVIMSLTTTVHAQNPSSWPLVEQCVSTTSENLDFEGTILLAGWAGIHGISAAFDTPVVRIFNSKRWIYSGASFLENDFAALSPDDRWLAIWEGQLEMDCPPCHRGDLRLDALLIYSTLRDLPVIRIPHSGTYVNDIDHSYGMRWLSNTQLLFAEAGAFERGDDPVPVMVYPFEEMPTIQDAPPLPYLNDLSLRPLHTRHQAIIFKGDISREFSNPITYFLADTQTGAEIKQLPYLTVPREIAISNSGTHIATVTDPEPRRMLKIIEIDTDTETSVNTVNASPLFSPSHTYMSWSHDDRYIVYHDQVTSDDPTLSSAVHIYIVDVQQRVVYDPCIMADSVHWSPNRAQLAISQSMGTWEPSSSVQILDLKNWTLHTVGHHAGPIIGWAQSGKHP